MEEMFAKRFIELCQEYFATLHKRVSEYFWNNSVYGTVKRAYYMCNFDVGLAEYYVPTVINGECFMQCHRIVVSILPELDSEIYEGEITRLIRPLSPRLGFIDSTTIFIVAPKVTKQHAFMVWKEKRKAMLKIKNVHGCFVIPIIHQVPEIAFKKLMNHIKNFWDKRVKAFLDKLKIQPWMYDYKIENLFSNTFKVIENYNQQIIYCIKSMAAHLVYFMKGLTNAIKLISKLNNDKTKIVETALRLAEAFNVLEPEKRELVLEKLNECLMITKS
jgi:hypothetical protein